MDFPRGAELFRHGILVGYRTRSVGGQATELWELTDTLGMDAVFQELLDVARYVLEKHPVSVLPRLVQRDPLVVSGSPWLPLKVLLGKPVAPELVVTFVHELSCALSLLPPDLAVRSMSPSTLAITMDGRPRVLDCTLSAAAVRTKTQPGVLKGDLSYMSPEQAKGLRLTTRSDVYVMGLVMLELLAGKHPVPMDRGMMETVRAMQSGIVEVDEDAVPAKMHDLIGRMLELDPEERLGWRGVANMIESDLNGYLWSLPRVYAELLRATPERPVM